MVKVIGAGFGRTGTHSMKSALELLGFGPCHHMVEVLSNPGQLARWRHIAEAGFPSSNSTDEFRDFFKNRDAAGKA